MNRYDIKTDKSIILNAEQLKRAGIDLKAMGQTSTKHRPYMVIAVNGQMTWLAPLTTVLKGKHGRVAVTNRVNNRGHVECEVVTTDMFSIATSVVEKYGHDHGWINNPGARKVRDQIAYSVHSGTLGRYNAQ